MSDALSLKIGEVAARDPAVREALKLLLVDSDSNLRESAATALVNGGDVESGRFVLVNAIKKVPSGGFLGTDLSPQGIPPSLHMSLGELPLSLLQLADKSIRAPL